MHRRGAHDDVISGGSGLDTIDGGTGNNMTYENADSNFTTLASSPITLRRHAERGV